MIITDINFPIIAAFNETTTASSTDDYLWALGDQLEDMPLLFKVARIFSCFLTCLCLDRWYLETVSQELMGCLRAKVEKECTNARIKEEVKQPNFSDALTSSDFDDVKRMIRSVKGLIDEQQNINSEAARLLQGGIDKQLVDKALGECTNLRRFNEEIRRLQMEKVVNVLLDVEGHDSELVRKACEIGKEVPTINLETEIRQKLQKLLEDFSNWKQQIADDASKFLTAGIDQKMVDSSVQTLLNWGPFSFLQKNSLSKTVAPQEITRIKNCLISEGHSPDAVYLAAEVGDNVSVLDLEKAIRQKLQDILSAAPDNIEIWLEKIKDIPTAYRDNLSKQFPPVFLGLVPYSDEELRPIIKSYNTKASDQFLNQFDGNYSEEANRLIVDLDRWEGSPEELSPSIKHLSILAMQEAVWTWQEKADTLTIFTWETMSQQIGEAYLQVLREAPEKRKDFFRYFTNGKDQTFKTGFQSFLQNGRASKAVDRAYFGFSNKGYGTVEWEYTCWKKYH